MKVENKQPIDLDVNVGPREFPRATGPWDALSLMTWHITRLLFWGWVAFLITSCCAGNPFGN